MNEANKEYNRFQVHTEGAKILGKAALFMAEN